MEHKNVEAAFLYMFQLLGGYKNLIQPNEYQNCIDILKQFYHGYYKCTLSADDLYNLIYKEDDLGKSIFDYVNETDVKETVLNMWENILFILLLIARIAYENEGAEYVPEDIECICIEKIDILIDKIKSNKSPKELIAYFKESCY